MREVKNELVHRNVTEHISTANCPLPTTEGFNVFRKERTDKGIPRGPRAVKPVKPVKVAKSKVAAKRGPGRPRVYDGNHRRTVASYLKKYGYTKGLELLRKERKLKVSMTLARSVAEAEGITFKRGRPAA